MSSDHVVQVTPECHPTPYQLYSSLPVLAGPNLIRVLDLSPLPLGSRMASTVAGSSATCNIPLDGILRIVKLTDSPKFAALSYVWGNEKSPDHTLTIRTTRNRGGTVWELNLTKNCHSALVHLRQQFGAMTIWVDSICINQQDNEEKSTQIPLMEQIYTWASPVYVWLGEGNPQSDRAMDTLSKAATYDRDLDILERLLYPDEGTWTRMVGWLRYLKKIWVSTHLSALRGWRIIFTKCRHPSKNFSPNQRLMSRYEAECLENLLASHHRNWSQRVWTLQEILLAGDIVIVCGSKAIFWGVFVRGLNYMQQMQQLESSMDIRQTLLEGVSGWCLLFNLWFNFGRAAEWNGRKKRYSPSDFRGVFKESTGWLQWLETADWLYTLCGCSLAFGMICLVSVSVVAITRYRPEEKANGGNDRLFRVNMWFPIIPFTLLFFYSILLVIGRSNDNTRISSKDGMMSPHDGNPRRAKSSITEEISTIDLLMQEVRQRIASDPKDKSYAMYGILRSLGASLSTPNYEKTLEIVFQELFSDLITWNSGFIRFLMDVKTMRDPQLEHAPTWVPVFHDCSASWLDSGYYNGTNHYSATSKGVIMKSGDRRAMATVDGRLLRTKIQRHGIVLFCSGVFGSTDEVEIRDSGSELRRKNISKFLLWLFHSWMRTPCTPAYESLPKAVLHVLKGRTMIPKVNEAFDKWYRAMMDLVTDVREFTKLTDGEFVHHVVEALKSDLVVPHYFTTCCIRLCSAKRNLFITSCGYLGSGPDTMVAGDVVALVPGVPVPMVLRSAQEVSHYTVVGPAFVQGLMKGEDWDENRLEEVVLI